jgi:amino acid adenylation domain-containing protein
LSLNDDGSATFHLLFEECARRFPDSVAVEFDGECLTYRELNRRANRLAHHLRAAGVLPDDRVAVLLRHPPGVVVAALAAIKAGGAYVPLDPDVPPGVTHRIVDDVAPAAMVVESSTSTGAVFFDVMADALDTREHDLEPVATPGNLAYVIYTSGTTGRPKGIAVEHRALVNTIRWRNAYYRFGPHDVVLGIPLPSFDSSIADTFCTLTTGARFLLPRRDHIADRRYLTDLIERHGVSYFLVTPALYERLLTGVDAGRARALRGVTIAGEGFTSSLVQEHFRRLPGVRLYNEYGPAENAVCSTVHLFSADDEHVLIGRPIDNVQAYVLDEQGAPVPPGGAGELYLGGAGLARGYLGNPELTAEKFLTLATPPVCGARVYRTGDVVRLLEDGNLQFAGRQDGQVKIRGRRVELGYVAETLARDPAVGHVHLLCRDAGAGIPRLVAFAQGAAVDIDRLTALAQANLPDYMIPATIIGVDELPLTRHGKVDEAALDLLYTRIAGRHDPGPEAATETQATLLAIWQKLFAPLQVGLDDDFFDLGGDSLGVMDLVAGVEERLGVQLDNTAVYQDRTIRSLAASLTNANGTGTGAA